MPQEFIHVKGAKEHNLKSVEVNIPREKLVVITGVSGSGKSSLAFDTIYAEGQRRYVESLSSYARQFLGRMDKPDVDYIEGLSPAISIDQKGVSHNPRSTVGTVTEIYDYLRLLFARVGKPHCPKCGLPVQRQTIEQIVDALLNLSEDSRITLLAPKIRRKKGEHKEIFESARKSGFTRVRVNNEIMTLDEAETISLDKQKWHYIDIVVDRLIIRPDIETSRVAESVETALREGNGLLQIFQEDKDDIVFSEEFACVSCGTSLPEIEPRTFSFNSPHGACNICTGLGYKLEVDPQLVIPNKDLSLSEGAISPWNRSGTSSTWYLSMVESVASSHGFSAKTPVKDLESSSIELILNGDSEKKITMKHKTRRGQVYSWDTAFEGVIPNLERRYQKTESDYVRHEIERYMSARPCQSCQGKRLRPEALAVQVCGINIVDVASMSISEGLIWVSEIDPMINPETINVTLTERERTIGAQILKEIEGRLKFLDNIGLGYLTMDRTARTLSGGEAQRVRLATQIGSGLTGVLYVCDEPTIGLHPHDDHMLITTLSDLRDMGNTVIVVEHDEAMMRSADHIIDMGPGAGEHGGNVVATGTISEIMDNPRSLTGQYLSGTKIIPLPGSRRAGNGSTITITGATENNLKNVNADIPLGCLVCVTGVSGSGKSTLIYDVLFKKLAQVLNNARELPGSHKSISGIEHIDKVVNIDQSPIGRTPRSNPTTYTGAFTPIRELFANLPEARVRGYKPGRFSFNVKGGRCEACQGEGYIQIEMQFLPDVTVPCEICEGRRYNREALEVTLRDKSIADILQMTVDQALDFFWNFPRIRPKLETLRDVGLGYIKLGQPATTLSGGEAQRVKLATELSKRATGKTLYLLDEPTTGLSFEDCAALLRVLHRLVDNGNTIVMIEHNLDLIKNSDWVIDLGPEAGHNGGKVIATGTPEQLTKKKRSHTGKYIKDLVKTRTHTIKNELTTVGD
ncbi:MAG: excinuclease ABC subunit A [Chloroflexi bacterium]|nr:excinuclease ABC subunit A [Chloroflexota bacterium]|tara:strand:+ start:1469 stop:4381 length:2913 start_codon:yes stop_codon:yes gene_type:complete